MNSSWLEDEMVQGECGREIASYWKENSCSDDPLTEWEAFKTTLRGTFVSITGVLYKNNQQLTLELETTMTAAERVYTSNPSPTSPYTGPHAEAYVAFEAEVL